jgi:Transient receptor potential (TRP) ion channel
MLYGDVRSLLSRGFLYAPYRAGAVWFVVASLTHAVAKAAIVAGAQGVPMPQAAALFALDVALLAALCVWRPYMDRAMNVVHIAVAAAAVVNATLLLLFSNAFRLPVRRPISTHELADADPQPLAIGVSGIAFFLANLLFYAVLLLATVHAAARALAPGLGRSAAWPSCSAPPAPREHALADERERFIGWGGVGTGLDVSSVRIVAVADDDEEDGGVAAPPAVAAEREEPSCEAGIGETAEMLEAIAAVACSGESGSSEYGSGSSAGMKLEMKKRGGMKDTYRAVVGRLGRWMSRSE